MFKYTKTQYYKTNISSQIGLLIQHNFKTQCYLCVLFKLNDSNMYMGGKKGQG